MKALNLRSLTIALALAVAPGAVFANSLTVSPTSITSPGQTATVTIRSGNQGTAHGQIRVYRSISTGQGEQLSPTNDVVASPPAFKLSRNQEATVRLVRRTNASVQGRECYRVLIDQLPEPERGGAAVKFTIRHSVPLCFVAGRN